jgi:hypothetical protein
LPRYVLLFGRQRRGNGFVVELIGFLNAGGEGPLKPVEFKLTQLL